MTRNAKLGAAGAVLLAGGIGAYWLRRPRPDAAPTPPAITAPTPRSAPAAAIPDVRFTDVTREAGIDFVHVNGAAGRKLLPETMGSGCAFLDYDADGDPDLLLVNGRPWPEDSPDGSPLPTPALYQNDGTGRFTNVTTDAGLDIPIYGMGVAAGDYDNDGYPDVYLTGVGSNLLLHNEGGRRFRDVTQSSGAAGDGGWSTGATFLDYDNDGALDLWVCNYVQWSREIDLAQEFQIAGVGRAYGPPISFAGAFSILYKGDGRGGFTDVSEQAGIRVRNPATDVPMGKSLAVLTGDFDRDGWTDVFVANDTVQNFLFHNQRDGTFREDGVRCGVAFDETGMARGAMGVDAADYRNDGLTGVAVANFANEMNALFTAIDADSPMTFTDAAVAEGVGPPSRLLLKFGLFFFDYDLDGRLDLLTADGHLDADISKVQASQRHAQPAQLFWNCGPDRDVSFVEATAEHAGPDLFTPIVGRGSAFADIDGDGDLDVALMNNGRRPLLLRNGCAGRNWVRLRLVGGTCNRDALGARVELHAGGVVQQREVRAARSYLSQSELVLTFGLGAAPVIERVVVTWPGNAIEEWNGLAINRLHVVAQAAPEREANVSPRR